MFDAIVQHLSKAKASSVATAYVTIFRPQTIASNDGPIIWNRQLIRYAGFKNNQTGEIVGDPMEVEFTNMLKKHFYKETNDLFEQ